MTVDETSLQEAAPVEAETSTQPQEVSPPVEEAQESVKPKADKDPIQRRFDQITWQKHELERRLNAEIAQRNQIEQRARELESQQQEILRRINQPRLEQYGDVDQYQRAMEQYNQAFLAQQQKALADQMEQHRQAQALQQFEQRRNAFIAEGVQKYPDFAEVVTNPSLPPLGNIHPAALEVLFEEGPALAYYLAKNPVEANRLLTMAPASAIKEMGKIASKLSAPAKPTSNAPAPVAQVGTANAKVDKDPSEMSYDEYVKWRRKGKR